MSRTIELDESGSELVLDFPFDRTTKDFVKALPRATFDWNSKTWRFPVEEAAAVVPTLVAHGFEPHATVRGLLGENEEGPPTATVQDVNRAIAAALNAKFPEPFWIAGEVANWSRNSRRRHAYFALSETNAVGRPEATIDAVMFGNARERIEGRLREAGLEIADGNAVRLLVRLEMYVERGRVQLVVDDIDVRYSAGELAVRREEILRALREKGVSERQLDRPMPMLPRRIALLTSAESDAYHDFVHTLTRARYGFDIVPFDVRVQGADLESTVTAALRAVEARRERFDLIVITRGGGSRTELAQWDNLRVAFAVCASRTKVVVAIGHQRDRSVLDDIATSFKTPTEAAERIVECWAIAEGRLEEISGRVTRQVSGRVVLERERLRVRAERLASASTRSLVEASGIVNVQAPRLLRSLVQQKIREARRSIGHAEDRVIAVHGSRSRERRARALDLIGERLVRATRSAARGAKRTLDEAASGLQRRTERRMLSETRLLQAAGAQLALADPARILRRGFAIVRDASGDVVTRAAGVAPQQILELALADGTLKTRVLDADTPRPPEESDG